MPVEGRNKLLVGGNGRVYVKCITPGCKMCSICQTAGDQRDEQQIKDQQVWLYLCWRGRLQAVKAKRSA